MEHRDLYPQAFVQPAIIAPVLSLPSIAWCNSCRVLLPSGHRPAHAAVHDSDGVLPRRLIIAVEHLCRLLRCRHRGWTVLQPERLSRRVALHQRRFSAVCRWSVRQCHRHDRSAVQWRVCRGVLLSAGLGDADGTCVRCCEHVLLTGTCSVCGLYWIVMCDWLCLGRVSIVLL